MRYRGRNSERVLFALGRFQSGMANGVVSIRISPAFSNFCLSGGRSWLTVVDTQSSISSSEPAGNSLKCYFVFSFAIAVVAQLHLHNF